MLSIIWRVFEKFFGCTKLQFQQQTGGNNNNNDTSNGGGDQNDNDDDNDGTTTTPLRQHASGVTPGLSATVTLRVM